MLTRFDVPHECRVVSAHRTPDWMTRIRQDGRSAGPGSDHRRRRRRGAPAGHGRGAHAAAGAGRAGAEPRACKGSTRCCRSCRCPAECPWRRWPSARPEPPTPPCWPSAFWPSAARNCARSCKPSASEQRRSVLGERCRDAADFAGRDGRRIGQRPTRPHVRHCRAAHGLSRAHVFSPERRHADRPGRRRAKSTPPTKISTRVRRVRPKGRRGDVRVREHPGRRSTKRRAELRRCARRRSVLHIDPASPAREDVSLREPAFRSRRFAAVRSPDELPRGAAELGTPAVLKTAGWGYDGKGQTKIGSPAEADGGLAERWRPTKPCSRRWSISSANCRLSWRAGYDGAMADYGRDRQHARQPYSRRLGRRRPR